MKMSDLERRKTATKIDILDLLISVLKDHEDALSHAVERLEVLASKQGVQEERMKTMLKYYSDSFK